MTNQPTHLLIRLSAIALPGFTFSSQAAERPRVLTDRFGVLLLLGATTAFIGAYDSYFFNGTSILSLIVLGVILMLRRDLFLICFDPTRALVLGRPVQVLTYLLLILLSLAIVASMKAVGLVLVISMLITPGATALLLTRRFDRMLVVADLHRDRLGAQRHLHQLLRRRLARRLLRAWAGPGFCRHPLWPRLPPIRPSPPCRGCSVK